jgi:hypothetical protein
MIFALYFSALLELIELVNSIFSECPFLVLKSHLKAEILKYNSAVVYTRFQPFKT